MVTGTAVQGIKKPSIPTDIKTEYKTKIVINPVIYLFSIIFAVKKYTISVACEKTM